MPIDIRRSLLLALLALTLVAAPLLAEGNPVQLSLFNPIQLVPESEDISLVRLNLIYAKNRSVRGIDWGLINHTTGGETVAWQMGLVGYVEADFLGLQDTAFNVVKGNFKGVQFGLFNAAGNAEGFQLGFVNHAESMHGLQIGLINIIKTGSQFPVLPIINWNF